MSVPSETLKVATALAESSAGKAALAERDAKAVMARKGYVAALKKLERDADEKFPGLWAAIEEATETVRKAEEKLGAARTEYSRAIGAKSAASHAYDVERQRLEELLKAEADPAIDRFRSEMFDEMTLARRSFHYHAETVRNPVTGHAATRTINNAVSVGARITAISLAMDAAEALRLDPDQSTIPTRLAELRDGLPKILPASQDKQK